MNEIARKKERYRLQGLAGEESAMGSRLDDVLERNEKIIVHALLRQISDGMQAGELDELGAKLRGALEAVFGAGEAEAFRFDFAERAMLQVLVASDPHGADEEKMRRAARALKAGILEFQRQGPVDESDSAAAVNERQEQVFCVLLQEARMGKSVEDINRLAASIQGALKACFPE